MILLAALLLQSPTPAQEPAQTVTVTAPLPSTPQTPATMVAEPVAMMIATFDADGDAEVDRSEMLLGVQASFEAIDTAKAGRLRYLAFADWAQRFLGDRNALPSPFEIDRNQDNEVSLDELQDQFSRLFARYDANKDKRVSRAELITYRTGPIGANGPTQGGGPGKPGGPPAGGGGRPPRR